MYWGFIMHWREWCSTTVNSMHHALLAYSHFAPLPVMTFPCGFPSNKSTPTDRSALTHHSGYPDSPKYLAKKECRYSGNVPARIASLARPITWAWKTTLWRVTASESKLQWWKVKWKIFCRPWAPEVSWVTTWCSIAREVLSLQVGHGQVSSSVRKSFACLLSSGIIIQLVGLITYNSMTIHT